MELEELSNLSKNDFLPLIPSIKQEQLDTALSDMDTQEHLTASTSAAAASTSSSSSSIVNHPCDSAEKRSESTSTSISSNISKPIATKCVFCAQTLGINDRPKLLECLHVTCSQCMSTKFAELDRTMPPLIHCPICNMASQNEFIIDNQFLIEHCTGAGDMSADANDSIGSKTSNNIPCSSCSDNNIATSWCVDCSEYICDSCVQAHQRLKITKDHTIKPKEEANNEQLPSSAVDKLHMCVLHPQEKLSLYCETCEKLTCRDCQLSDHRDHKYKFAHEIATETRHAITSMVAEINYKRFLLTSAMQVIAERQKVISDKKKELIKEITAMVVTITNTVNMRGKQLVMRLNEVCDGKLKLLVDKRDSLISLSDNTDYCIDFIANVLDKGSDYAILSSKKSLVRHLQKLKCQRADIPNPDIPLRIDLQMCQIQQLQKEISRLGNILVDGKPYPPQPSPPPQQQQRQQPSPIWHHFATWYATGNAGCTLWCLPPSLAMQRQGQPHVSSSTHPQNRSKSTASYAPFNGPPSYPGGPQGAPSPQQMGPQMRQHLWAVHRQRPLHVSNHTKFVNHAQQQAAVAAMASSGQGQIPSPNAMQRPQMHHNPMQNVKHGVSRTSLVNAGHPQTSPQLGGGGAGGGAGGAVVYTWLNGIYLNLLKVIVASARAKFDENTTPPTTGSSAGHGMPGGGWWCVAMSPHMATSKDFTEPIDKVRDDSINDLMATIAKLDSNGCAVHNTKTTEKDDPNEDWCAVCLDGGELMCCDKCPKVFHQNCHIPAISSLPDESESWQCLLCVNLKELASNPDNLQKNPGELSRLELQILQRICLELFCQYEQSLHFREPEPPSNTAYYEIVCNPMSLDVIRTRLDPSSQNHYKDISSFIADVRLIFKNTYLFYQEDSKTYTNAKYLENFFEEQLAKWLPSYANKSINANNANSILNSGPGSALSNGNNNGNNSNSASTSASPAPGAPSPSLENGGRKSSNSAMLNMNTNSNGSSASTHRSDDNNIDDGCNPAKRQRKQTE
ncbi:E3 ubiquitin-protein ligase TRIM33 [Lucilia cuprina]|nr:E3 ubiquitin-protein ligase TRIM33 [Lucilia cuprina]KAI8120752.1 E3 ubiquitin-protein ligase TRIM33 [Lucilia cuprina]